MPDWDRPWRQDGGVGGGNFTLLLGCRVLVAITQREQRAPRGQGHPVIYPECRFPFLKREESGSLIKGAWLECPVIIGARNLNFKRSVQLHFKNVGGTEKYRLWARMWLNQIWEVRVLAEFPFKFVFILPIFLFFQWEAEALIFFFFLNEGYVPVTERPVLSEHGKAERSCCKLEGALF